MILKNIRKYIIPRGEDKELWKGIYFIAQVPTTKYLLLPII